MMGLCFSCYVVFYMTRRSLGLIGWWIFIARASAFAACMWTALLFMSMSRNFMTWLSKMHWVQNSPTMLGVMACHKELHIFAAVECLLDGCLHTIMHFCGTLRGVSGNSVADVNQALACADLSIIPGHLGFVFPAALRWPECPVTEENKPTYGSLIYSATGITGIVLLVVIFGMYFFSRQVVRTK